MCVCRLTNTLHTFKSLDYIPAKERHTKAVEQVTGVISKITYTSPTGIQQPIGWANTWEKSCMHHLAAIRQQIASDR